MRRNRTCKSPRNLGSLALMLSLILLSLPACGTGKGGGGSETSGAGGATDAGDGYVYLAKYQDMEGMNGESRDHFSYVKGCVYYLQSGYDAEKKQPQTGVYRQDLKTNTVSRVDLSDGSDGNAADALQLMIYATTTGDDGSVYLVGYELDPDGSIPAGGFQTIWLRKYAPDGRLAYQKDISEQADVTWNKGYIQQMGVDGEGNVCVALDRCLLLFDREGNPTGRIPLDIESIKVSGSGMGRGKDGLLYMLYFDADKDCAVAAQIDFAKGDFGATYKDLPFGNDRFKIGPGIGKNLLIGDSFKLYEYDTEQGGCEEILTWKDNDVNGGQVGFAALAEDGRILTVLQDWQEGTTQIALLDKTAAAELPQKEEIVIGVMTRDMMVENAVREFNRRSDRYHATIKEYWEFGGDYLGVMDRINMDLVSGKGPDLMSTVNLEPEELARRGVAEDLRPYLAASSVLKEEDIQEDVLRVSTVEDKLVCLCRSFSIVTLAGRTAEVGETVGWSVQDYIRFAKTYTNRDLLDQNDREGSLMDALMYGIDSFVDREKGTCDFDSEEFVELLQTIKDYPVKSEWYGDVSRMADGSLKLAQVCFSDFYQVQMYRAMFNEDITFVGYPTADGHAGCGLSGNDEFVMLSTSKHKEGAWNFLEELVTMPWGKRDFGFPSYRKVLEAQAEQAMQDDAPKDRFFDTRYKDWKYETRPCTQEEIDVFWDTVRVAIGIFPWNEARVGNIILEEAESYFAGVKSAEEAARIIQNRASICLAEWQ